MTSVQNEINMYLSQSPQNDLSCVLKMTISQFKKKIICNIYTYVGNFSSNFDRMGGWIFGKGYISQPSESYGILENI